MPESSQPYHAAIGRHRRATAGRVKRLVAIVKRFARRSVAGLIEEYAGAGRPIFGAGIVVGSDVDPGTIPNDHIRAHAEEGRLFRVVLENAASQCGLAVSVMLEKELPAKAARLLRVPEGRLKDEVSALGRALGGPWRAEDKAAAMAAWLMLAARGGRNPGKT